MKKITSSDDYDKESKEKEAPAPKPAVERTQGSRLVTSDGTYATQSAFSMQQPSAKVQLFQFLTVKIIIRTNYTIIK